MTNFKRVGLRGVLGLAGLALMYGIIRALVEIFALLLPCILPEYFGNGRVVCTGIGGELGLIGLVGFIAIGASFAYIAFECLHYAIRGRTSLE